MNTDILTSNLCLHDLFETQADLRPDVDSVVMGRERLSYRELDRRSNRFANHLRRLGVGPDVLVGLLLERSADLVAAVLGVLKAGGAFLPLDERSPQERLAFMLEDSGASLVVTQRSLVERLDRVDPFIRRLRLDASREAIARESAERPAGGTDPDNLAYVIYTSGSTGRPKGVLVPHRGLVNAIAAKRRTFGVRPGDRVLQFASWSFDASVMELILALPEGAALCLATPDAVVPGRPLVELMRRERVTHALLSPSVLAALPESPELPDLRVVIAGAEACPASLVARWGRGRRFFNAYGPTEATIWTTVAECRPGTGRPPIGRPMPNAGVHLLGPDLEPVADGDAGEVFIGGAGVTRGYLRRPDLTAERFVPDPFSGVPGARLYRTGDLARRLADGQFDFVGRADHQVKIGGVRVEPGEVEALLESLPEVRGSVVMAREDGAGGKRLVAYLVADGEPPSPATLRSWLRERLPEVMVPSAFVTLDAWPLNPSGKVDRAALPEPREERAAAAPEWVAPRGPLEERIAAVWRELLGVERPGVHDDLFMLGARSLVVTQLVARLRDAFHVELPLREIFEHPTIAGLAGALERARQAHRPELPPIERAPRDRPLPLSFPQERVWFLQQLAPDSIAYNTQMALRFSGPLDPEVYARALTEIVRRHEVLRTTFPAVDGRPVQAIHPPFAVPLPVVDLSTVPAAEREALAERLIAEELRWPFDLTKLPLARWKLLRLAADDHVLVQVEHHFVHDGWSFALLLREMRALYEAFAAGRPSPLPEPEVQYADFAAWQRQWMQGEVLAENLAFWTGKLAGSPPALELPTDRPRPAAHSFRGAAPRFHLPDDLYRDLRALAKREGVTLYMLMLAAFDALLHRYSGQEDLLVGSGVANRRSRQIEGMIGMVVNTIVFRTSVAGDPTFRELLARVRQTTLEARAYEDVPFDRVVAEIAPDRDLGRNPLFQVMFSFHDAAVPDLEFAGLSGTVRELHNGSAKTDLNIVCIPRAEQRFGLAATGEERITVIWEHSADLWDGATIERMIRHWENLLRAAVAGVERRLSELPMLTPEEEALLAAVNDTTAISGGPMGLPVHERVARQAALRPEALAVAAPDGRLTYAELDRRAAGLARILRGLGAGPERPVAVCLERSAGLVIAALAALKAGAPYLPLDPSAPPERLAWMLADAGAPVLVTREATAAALPPHGAAVVTLGSLEALAGLEDAEPALSMGTPRTSVAELAYLIYTSGSTGTPKAVEVPHAGLTGLVDWHQRAYGIGPDDRATLLAGPAFDASVWEVWPYLTAGASLHVPAEETRAAAPALLAWLAEEGITVSFMPTPLAEAAFAEALPPGLALRFLLTGGDRLGRHPRRPLPFALVNHYGPTESSVVATAAPVPAGLPGAPPIGRPIAGTLVHLLDRGFARVPVGVPGELCLAGAGLARGYRGRPELTAERFVPDPFTEEPGGRLYRTGDLTRLVPGGLPGGQLEFLGRVDHQVKVRGFRIEPGEIEAALRACPGVRQAVVGTDETAGGEKRLVAWVVPVLPEPTEAAEAPAADDLAAALAGRLPAFMVPSAFVVLPELPLTANGKVDRRALERLAPAAAAEAEAAAPRDPIEEVLAGIWAAALGRERVGVDDSFFALGGHSLLAARVIARVREALGVDLPIRALFERPTVAGLAELVAATLREGAGPALPPLARSPETGPAPLSFPQLRLWFVERLAPDNPTYNIPAAFRLRGPLDRAALAESLAAVVRRHRTLRTRFFEVGGEPFQEVVPAAPVPLPEVDLSGLDKQGAETALACLRRREAGRPFDLAAGRLLRATLVRLAAEEHALLLTMHHIASDGWSLDLLHRELATLYGAALARERAALPELPVHYADFALWQRAWPASVLDAQTAYWRGQLAGLATLELPADRPRPPMQTFRGARVRLELPPELGAALTDLSRRQGATLFMTLLAAYQGLLARLSGQADVAVGSPVANRDRAEIEGLVGFFVNMLALRTDASGDPTFAELLGRARRVALDAYAHQELPFERLVDELAPERDLSRQPLVQVMIALQSAPPEPLALPGLDVVALEPLIAIAKFDLTLYLTLRDGALEGLVEYATDLIDRATVARFAGRVGAMLAAVAARPEARLSEIELLSPAERHQLVAEWNDTRQPFPAAALMHQLFEARADASPGALAAVWNGEALTYGDLEARANRIASLLRTRGLERGQPVGVWMERSLDMVAAVLGALKAGGWYLPLDGAWPADRVESILGTTAAPAVLTRSAHLGRVLEMQWRLPALRDVVCLDVEAPVPAPEPVDVEGMRALFDLVAERAVDRATAGGFVSSFTGQPFSEEEVDEYRDRVLGLAEPWLTPEARVLEIGSGSGVILWEVAPRVARCVGLDPSPLTQERNRAEAERQGLANVELPVGFAHETMGWADGSFDLVIVASTAQFFPGPLYLERVVGEATRLLAPGGGLVIADVPDARRQGELARAIAAHRAGPGAQDPHKVLALDEDLFRDLAASMPGVGEVSVRHRDSGFDNELKYRYDVVLTKGAAPAAERRKSLWTSWHVEQRPAARPSAVAAPEDLAYVIHTSGSTGQPKGIAVQHRPVANLIHWINREFGIGPADRVLFVTSLCFDLSVWDVFGLLAAGGTIHVASEAELADAERLVQILVEEPITVWDSAPAALVRLAPLFSAKPVASSRLRRVMLSGDWIPVTLPDRVRAAFPHAEVMSLGGATEATVWSNWFPIGEVDPSWPSIPYGRPIGNARYHVLDVLDGGLAPCPVGVPGDLYIGGEVLCVGYLQPELTAAAFVPDPFAIEFGARLYRTGDRARYLADGNLEFLGRVDHQVKIRGFRIELGEIEVALARHAGVREAVVLAREDVPGEKRLVAYVVPSRSVAPSGSELRDFLRLSLPEYMIPSAFVALDAFPVTANGKLDRQALPAPVLESGARDERPRTPTEEALAGIWREVLGVERVGLSDSFFDLGGHSLLATQLVARLRDSFGAEVPLRAVFQSPALAELAAFVDAARPAHATEAPAPGIIGSPIRPVPRDGEGGLPLSASQLRQWFLVQLDPASADYNLPIGLRLDGDLDRAALTAALAEIVRRHESLRTTFAGAGGRPVAVVSPDAVLPLAFVDLAAQPAAERAAEVRRLAAAEAGRPFDLATGPLLRGLLLRLGPAEHLLALTIHHIVFDGWSLGVLLRELAALYAAFTRGLPSPLPELPIQYADYAAWQAAELASPAMASRVSRWKERLAGAPPALELPADRPRPAVQSHRGGLLPLAVPAGLAAGLKDLAGREGGTLFMVLLAGYAALLSRITGQTDLSVGTYVANRPHEVLERLVGFFVNTVVLRADLSGDPSFREVVARLRDTTLDAFDDQEVPFERLLDELEIDRDLSRTPLFQVMFGVQNFAMPAVEAAGLAIRPVHVAEQQRTAADLGFWMWEAGDELTGWVQWSTDLFDAATVERLLGRLTNLLAAAAADPELRLSALPLMPEAERRQVLSWSAGPARREAPRPVHREAPRSVHERLRERACLAPEAPAVVAFGRTLTYAELDRRADAVARGLARLGAGPERVVGLAFDRSPETIAALFGILRAGAAYLPLDPALPAERLALLLADAGALLVLTRSALSFSLPELPARLVTIEELVRADAGTADGADLEAAALESAAYVLYTSGSTGAPKGVVVEHRSLAAFVEAAVELYGIGPRDRVLQFASLAFDTSVEEIYPCLAAGGTLVLRDEEMIASPERFFEACGEAGVTVLDLPTAYWHELSGWVEKGGAVPEDVRLVILGGERALPERVAGWLAATGHGAEAPRLVNSYGPTEGTVVATACDLGEAAPAVPIGRPLPGVEVFVLDRQLAPVPAGVPGEIWLGGAGLARGYLGRPDLTAERFVPSPFGPAGARLYRTGDLGRWRADGALDFAGRADDQVKIRGFRIEPGEVAAALARHPSICEAVVVAHETRPGERELAAYAVPVHEPWPSVVELRTFLRDSLPAAMVPADLLLLDALPRTATGKVDRKALPVPERAARAARGHQPPSTPTEMLVAGLWERLLGVEGIGLHDDFFDLGGHSLLAPQVIAGIKETFGVELGLRTLFESPTVARTAEAVEQALLAQIEDLSDEEAIELLEGKARERARGARRAVRH